MHLCRRRQSGRVVVVVVVVVMVVLCFQILLIARHFRNLLFEEIWIDFAKLIQRKEISLIELTQDVGFPHPHRAGRKDNPWPTGKGRIVPPRRFFFVLLVRVAPTQSLQNARQDGINLARAAANLEVKE